MFQNIKKIFNRIFIRKKHFKLYKGQECYEITNDKVDVHRELERAVELYKDLTEPSRKKRKDRQKKLKNICSKLEIK